MMKPKTSQLIRWIAGTAIVVVTTLIFLNQRPAVVSSGQTPPPTIPSHPAPTSVQGRTSSGEDVMLRPLPVALSSARHEWTTGDCRSLAIIEKISHNPDESIRMIEENDRIKRRQLVYRKETLPMLIERARGSGQPLTTFTLPGLDGKEVEVEVTEIHEEPSLHGGSVIGHVKGRFNSMVSVGYVNGHESFNVLSPDDGLYLTADAREPGEVIVKEIDPNQYAPISGNEPDFILTHEPLPQTH